MVMLTSLLVSVLYSPTLQKLAQWYWQAKLERCGIFRQHRALMVCVATQLHISNVFPLHDSAATILNISYSSMAGQID